MTPDKQLPAVVAELGRPEKPEETAQRKAATSRQHRERQTVTNLIYSLIATVGLVVVIVLMVPRGTPIVDPPVKYDSIAASAQGSEPDRLVSPKLPSGWKANAAQLNSGTPGGVDSWYIGLITPSKEFLGITQGFKANETWLAQQLNDSLATGTRTIDGVTWTVYDNRKSGKDNGNLDYALTATAAHSTYIIFGTASQSEFETAARALAPEILANGPSK